MRGSGKINWISELRREVGADELIQTPIPCRTLDAVSSNQLVARTFDHSDHDFSNITTLYGYSSAPTMFRLSHVPLYPGFDNHRSPRNAYM